MSGITPDRLDALAIAAVLEAQAAAHCPNHADVLLDLQIDDDLLAARQTQAWTLLLASASAEGFDGDPDRYLQGPLIFALQSVCEVCPKCGAKIDPPDDPALARKPRPFA